MDKSSQQSRTFDLRIFAALLVSAFAVALAFTLSPASAYAADGSDSKASAPTEQAAQTAAKSADTGKAATAAAATETAKATTATQDAQAAKPAAATAADEPAKAASTAKAAKTEAEPKAETKAEVKEEAKAETKTEAKAEAKTATKTEAKAEAKAETAKASTTKTAAAEKAPAQAKKKTYTVKFYDAYGNVVKTQKVKAGKNAKAPKLTKMANRTFKKWDTSFKKVSSNLYVHPIFKDSKKIYNLVTDYRENQYNSTSVNVAKYKAGTKITLGYASYNRTSNLIGYSTNPDGTGKFYSYDAEFKMPSKDLFLYPQYSSSKLPKTKTLALGSGCNGYSQTYDLVSGAQIRIGSSIQVNDGYTLVGYSSKKNGKGKFYALGSVYTMPNKNVNLYGVWKKNTAKLTLKANFKKGNDVVYYVPKGYALPLTSNSYAFTQREGDRDGYTLKSFTTKKKGGKKYTVYSDEPNLLGGALSYVTVPKKGLTLYAQWAKDKAKKITYVGNGGSVESYSSSAKPGDSVYINSYGYRDGYQLVGFSAKKNGSGAYYYPGTFFTMPNKNLKLYAQWKKYNTKVTVKGADSKQADNVIKAVAGYAVELYGNYDYQKMASASKYLVGYNAKKNGKGAATYLRTFVVPKAKKGTTLYQKWAKGVKLTYDTNYKGASKASPSVYVKGATVTVYSDSERYRDGYTFMGWSKKKSGKVLADRTQLKLKKNMTLYAQWKKDSVKVTLNGNGGTMYSDGKQSKTSTVKAAKGTQISTYVDTPYRDKYTFIGWNTKKNGKGSQYSSDDLRTKGLFKAKKMTLYAQWVKTPTIVFYANNGTKEEYTSTDAYDLRFSNGFTFKKGKVLASWNTKKNGKGVSLGVADNLCSLPAKGLKLYAQWKSGTAKITYNADGKAKNQVVKALGNAYSIAQSGVSTPTNSDYYFKDWYTKKNGQGDCVYTYSSAQYVPKKGVTYYALWGKKMTVKLDANGGTGSATAKLSGNYSAPDCGIYLDDYSSKFSKSGYTLLGWDTNKSATFPTYDAYSSIYYDSDDVSFKDGGTMTLYAIWQADSEV